MNEDYRLATQSATYYLTLVAIKFVPLRRLIITAWRGCSCCYIQHLYIRVIPAIFSYIHRVSVTFVYLLCYVP